MYRSQIILVTTMRSNLDKADGDILHDDITVMDHALSHPVIGGQEIQARERPLWAEYVCNEGNEQIRIGKESYMITSDGYLMPVQKDQAPPDLK